MTGAVCTIHSMNCYMPYKRSQSRLKRMNTKRMLFDASAKLPLEWSKVCRHEACPKEMQYQKRQPIRSSPGTQATTGASILCLVDHICRAGFCAACPQPKWQLVHELLYTAVHEPSYAVVLLTRGITKARAT